MPNDEVPGTEDPIRVSELAEFVYCQRSCWLKMVQKKPSDADAREAQAQGEMWHKEEGERRENRCTYGRSLCGSPHRIPFACVVRVEFFEMILLTAAILALFLGFVLLRRSQQRRRQFILIDKNNTIVAGHGRLHAAPLLDINRGATIRLETLADNQVRAYGLANNKLTEISFSTEKKIQFRRMLARPS
jgi:hypothetical protein